MSSYLGRGVTKKFSQWSALSQRMFSRKLVNNLIQNLQNQTQSMKKDKLKDTKPIPKWKQLRTKKGKGGREEGLNKEAQMNHRTSAWRPACNLTPVASYITCHQILNVIHPLRMVPRSLQFYSKWYRKMNRETIQHRLRSMQQQKLKLQSLLEGQWLQQEQKQLKNEMKAFHQIQSVS